MVCEPPLRGGSRRGHCACQPYESYGTRPTGDTAVCGAWTAGGLRGARTRTRSCERRRRSRYRPGRRHRSRSRTSNHSRLLQDQRTASWPGQTRLAAARIGEAASRTRRASTRTAEAADGSSGAVVCTPATPSRLLRQVLCGKRSARPRPALEPDRLAHTEHLLVGFSPLSPIPLPPS
jgi:hypothetical protein